MKELYKEMLEVMEKVTIDKRAEVFCHPYHGSFDGLCLLYHKLMGSRIYLSRREDMRKHASKFLGEAVRDLHGYWFTSIGESNVKAKQERIDFLKWAIKHI